jgi:uncharacterized protein
MAKEFEVSVRDLMHKPGNMRRVDFAVALPEELSNSILTVPAGTDLELELRLESVHEGILATGGGDTFAIGECSRCLDPIEVDVKVDFVELFAYSLINEDDFVVEDEKIDLEQVIRDEVVPNLPSQPLCKEDCLGLCVECGEKLSDNPNHEHESPVDPRWKALENFEKE